MNNLKTQYEIFADEAWTHSNEPLNRYWCFHGGIFGTQNNLDRFETELKKVLDHHGHLGEVKWSKLNALNLSIYTALVDCLFKHIKNGDVKYRQSFLDRSFVHQPKHKEKISKEIDTQFKIYYQFIKHAFGLQYMPEHINGCSLLIRLDNHSSQNHKARLIAFAEELPQILERPDLSIKVTFHNSKHFRKLQICDLVMGAAGSYGNKMHEKREPGYRGMKPKQKIRLKFCKHIYNGLRDIDAQFRGSKAFNWFEATGLNDDRQNLYDHPMRIWKIIPKRHLIDKGWHNDHLDAQGYYQGPDIFLPK